MASSDYPFSGVDMLQNSMSQLVGELRQVGDAIRESARSISSYGMHQASQFAGFTTSANNALVGGAASIMAAPPAGTNFFRETFSSQFNKPSLWSRDLVAMAGLRTYDDMYKSEAQRYARHNLGYRAEMAGLKTMQTAGSLASWALPFPANLVVGLGVNATLGEYIKNRQQENDWWGYLDKVGRNNALLGKGGTGTGWTDSSLKDMSKWLSTQDKAWYNRGAMKQEDMQTTIAAAEMQGYFFNTVDPQDFKRKVTKLVNNTKDIMRTMKMANDEAAALIGEMEFFGYKDSNRTIKEMNRTAAMTGLSFSDVKNFGMEYAKTNYAAFLTDKETSTGLALDVMNKYDKKNTAGMQFELGAIGRVTTDNAVMLATTKYVEGKGWIADTAAAQRLAGANPVELMNAARENAQKLSNLPGGVMGTRWLELMARGPALLQSMDPKVVQRLALGQAAAATVDVLARLNPKEYGAAMKKGGGNIFDAWQYFSKDMQAAAMSGIAERTGASMEAIQQTFNANIAGAGESMSYGPLQNLDIKGPSRKVSGGFLGLFPKYEQDQDLPTRWADMRRWDYWQDPKQHKQALWLSNTQNRAKAATLTSILGGPLAPGIMAAYDINQAIKTLTPGDNKYSRLSGQAFKSITDQAMFMYAMNNPGYDAELSGIENRLKEVTGLGGYDSMIKDSEKSLIRGLSAMTIKWDNGNAERLVRSDIASYIHSKGVSETDAWKSANAQFNIGDMQERLLNKRGNAYKSLAAMADGKSLWNSDVVDKQLLEGGREAVTARAYKATINTDAYANAYLDRMKKGEAFNPNNWSPTLSRLVTSTYGTKSSEKWANAVIKTTNDVRRYEQHNLTKKWYDTGYGIEEKAESLFNKAMNAQSAKDLQKYAEDYADYFSKRGGSSEVLGSALMQLRHGNKYGDYLPEVQPLLQAMAPQTILGTAFNSKYADLFNTGAMGVFYNQLADKSSVAYQRALNDPTGTAKEMTNTMAMTAKRVGRPLSAAQLKELEQQSLEMIKAVGSGEEGSGAMQQLAIETNRMQNTLEGRLDTSNQYLRSIASAHDGGSALRVVTISEKKSKALSEQGIK